MFWVIPSVFRWGNLPIDEARTFGHMQVVEFLESVQTRIVQISSNSEEKSQDFFITEK